jgi:chromatin remodeling complex protein RSC6
MARGGLRKMTVNFKGMTATLEKVFGAKPIPVTEMTKKIWGVIKRNKLLKTK